jgi:type VI secretion system protein ImpK
MEPSLAKPIIKIFQKAFMVLDSIDRNVETNFYAERATLSDLLTDIPEIDSIQKRIMKPEFNNDTSSANSNNKLIRSKFLGVRYPLTCWIDELFTHPSCAWANKWNEQKLEIEFYDSNDRAWQFWDQAKLAEEFTNLDYLEIFFLASVLGFYGTKNENSSELIGWQKKTAHKLNEKINTLTFEWDSPMLTNVSPRIKSKAFKSMLVITSLLFSTTIPIVAFLFFSWLSSN